MSKTEKSILNIIKENYTCTFWGAATILGLLLRICCLNFLSGDMNDYLLWYEEISENGFQALSHQVGHYSILYQFIIYILTLLPLEPIYAYKILFTIFDYAMAITTAFIVDGGHESFFQRLYSLKFVSAYALILFCPTVFLNSAFWGQCDSVYCFLILLSLYCLINKKYRRAFIFYGAAFAFKFHAVFALPFLLILYLISEEYSISKFLYIPLVVEISALPGILCGRGILSPILIYFNQTETFAAVSMNYPSFWNIPAMTWKGASGNYSEFKLIAVIFTAIVLGIILMFMIKCPLSLSPERITALMQITVYTSILFLPTMHDRYGFLYEITGIILAFYNRKYILPSIGLIIISCITYSRFLFGVDYPMLPLSVANTLLFLYYLFLFFSEDHLPVKGGA